MPRKDHSVLHVQVFRLMLRVPSVPWFSVFFFFYYSRLGLMYFLNLFLTLQRLPFICQAGMHHHSFIFNHIFLESRNRIGIWFSNQRIPPSTSKCLSTTDFLLDKLGTSENRMRSLRPTALLSYNILHLHNILKYTVSYKCTYFIIFFYLRKFDNIIIF